MSAWYPSFDSSVPRSVVEAIRRALDQLYAVRERTDTIQAAGYVTGKQAANLYGAVAQQQALQATGPTPLNVTGLVGLLSQPQKAYVPFVDTLPDVLHDPMSQDGALVAWNQVVYWFDGRIEPGRWRPLGAVGIFLSGTHAQRLATAASDLPLDVVFWETDRTVLYKNEGVYGASAWRYIMGTMWGGVIPTDLGANDVGFLYHIPVPSSANGRTLRWNGVRWTPVTELGICFVQAHWARYSAGTCDTRYPTGTVNTAGVNVARVAGDTFDTSGYWPGKTIRINGVDYTILTVTDANNLVLTATAGIQAAVVYLCPTISCVFRVAGGYFDATWADRAESKIIVGPSTIYTVIWVSSPDRLVVAEVVPVAAGLAFAGTGFHPMDYPEGVGFWETDRTVTYLTRNSAGVVDTVTLNPGVDSTVTWISDNKFSRFWVGRQLTIDGVSCVVSAFNTTVDITVTPDLGARVGVAYLARSGHWKYRDGVMIGTLAPDQKPADLFEDHDLDFRFECADLGHTHRWCFRVALGTWGWDFAPGDPGSGQIVFGAAVPLGWFWVLCDGAATTIATPDGLPFAITTPNLTGNVFPKFGVYTGVVNVATSPTWAGGARTDDESAHTHPIGDHTHPITPGSADVEPDGLSVPTCPGSTDAAGAGVTGAGSAHNHTLSNGVAVINPPTEANGGLPQNIALAGYMRR